MSRLVLIGVSGLLMVTGSASAGIVLDDKSDFEGADFIVIDFETRGDGSSFGLEPTQFLELPEDEYASSGVLISASPNGAGGTRAALGNSGTPQVIEALWAVGSPTHVLGDRLFGGFLRFDFLVPVNAFGVSIVNRSDGVVPSISVFDASEELLGTVEFTNALIDGLVAGEQFGVDTDQQFGFAGWYEIGSDIAYAVVSEDVGLIDDLHFGIIPEPTTILLIIMGVTFALVRGRRSKARTVLIVSGIMMFPQLVVAGTISGTVRGYSTPYGSSFKPDSVTNLPQLMILNGVMVYIEEDSSVFTFTDESGAYTLNYTGGLSSVNVTAELKSLFDEVINLAGPGSSIVTPDPASVQVNSFPAAGIDLTFNPPDPVTGFADSEATTASVNAFIHMQNARDFLQTYTPSSPIGGLQLASQVMNGTVCADGGTGSQLVFSKAGLGDNTFCSNGAYSTLVAHEFGHFINVNSFPGGLPDSFDEGFADSFALMVYAWPIIGQEFGATPDFDHSATRDLFPDACSGGPGDCRHVLSGVWWDIKENLQAKYATIINVQNGQCPPPFQAINNGHDCGLELVRSTFGRWMLLTEGQIDPDLAREILLADDNDGDLSNSTPHFEEICTAFKSHGSIVCPYDCRGDGKHNSQYIAEGASDDNANGVPDDCDTIVYVDQNSTITNPNGQSWAGAFRDLQAAFGRINCCGTTEIWVADGTYTPHRGCSAQNCDATRSFAIGNTTARNVRIFGGFKGLSFSQPPLGSTCLDTGIQCGETRLDQRNFRNNLTSLSGDLLGDDGPNFTNRSDNSHHVLNFSNTAADERAVFDGFTISGGNAPLGNPGGITGFGGLFTHQLRDFDNAYVWLTDPIDGLVPEIQTGTPTNVVDDRFLHLTCDAKTSFFRRNLTPVRGAPLQSVPR